MDKSTNGPQRRKSTESCYANKIEQREYCFLLQLYRTSPDHVVDIVDFEEIAFERLHILDAINKKPDKGTTMNTRQLKESTKNLLKNIKLDHLQVFENGIISNDINGRLNDNLSHFVLRLAFCQSLEMRTWFLNAEAELFNLRLSEMSKADIETFLLANNLKYRYAESVEKEKFSKQIIASTPGATADNFDCIRFYKVPFQEVCDLVKDRDIFLNGGNAFLPESLFGCILSNIFRKHLKLALHHTFRYTFQQIDDDRVHRAVTKLQQYFLSNINKKKGKCTSKYSIDPANIEQHVKENFPLCMQHIHEVLRSKHHLKHHCRMQYGTFLKDVGFSLEDSLQFFQKEFEKGGICESEFHKKYAYYIKHYYGKVGRKLAKNTYSCGEIIDSRLGPGDHHGCPFKHWDVSVLRQKLDGDTFCRNELSDIEDLIRKGHYQGACTEYFQCVHKSPMKTVIHNPVEYFQNSLQIQSKRKINIYSEIMETDDIFV